MLISLLSFALQAWNAALPDMCMIAVMQAAVVHCMLAFSSMSRVQSVNISSKASDTECSPCHDEQAIGCQLLFLSKGQRGTLLQHQLAYKSIPCADIACICRWRDLQRMKRNHTSGLMLSSRDD